MSRQCSANASPGRAPVPARTSHTVRHIGSGSPAQMACTCSVVGVARSACTGGLGSLTAAIGLVGSRPQRTASPNASEAVEAMERTVRAE